MASTSNLHGIQDMVDDVKAKLTNEEYLKFCDILKNQFENEEKATKLICEIRFIKPCITQLTTSESIEENDGCIFILQNVIKTQIIKIDKKLHDKVHEQIVADGLYRWSINGSSLDGIIKTKDTYELTIDDEICRGNVDYVIIMNIRIIGVAS